MDLRDFLLYVGCFLFAVGAGFAAYLLMMDVKQGWQRLIFAICSLFLIAGLSNYVGWAICKFSPAISYVSSGLSILSFLLFTIMAGCHSDEQV
jgi:hypothetical protein